MAIQIYFAKIFKRFIIEAYQLPNKNA